MKYTVEDVLQYVESEDVKFIRLAFCDGRGRQKNLAVMPASLEEAFRQGVAVDVSGLEGFEGQPTLLLRPDPATLTQMPWRPQHGRVVHLFCELLLPDGTPYPEDRRRALGELAAAGGYTVETALDFTLYKLDEQGEATGELLDQGGWLDVAPADKGENVRRAVCLTLEQMGIQPTRSHHGAGPGRNLIQYAPADPVSAADHLVLFRDLVRTIAVQNGLCAGFSDSRFTLTLRRGEEIVQTAQYKGGEQDPYALLLGLLQAL